MMNDNHEVISAFLDDEPFDPNALAGALSEPEGRAFLLDIISLRRLAQPTEAAPPVGAMVAPARSRWGGRGAAAAGVVGVTGGYLVGERRSTVSDVEATAPTPTRVVQAEPFTPTGGGR